MVFPIETHFRFLFFAILRSVCDNYIGSIICLKSYLYFFSYKNLKCNWVKPIRRYSFVLVFQAGIWLCFSSFLLFRTCNGCIFFLGNLMWLLFVWKKWDRLLFDLCFDCTFTSVVLLCVYIISPCFYFFKMEYYLNWRNCIYATYRFACIADILHWLLSAGMIW